MKLHITNGEKKNHCQAHLQNIFVKWNGSICSQKM